MANARSTHGQKGGSPTNHDDIPLKSINDSPSDGQVVSHLGKSFKTVKEGLAYILVPEDARTSLDPKAQKSDQGDTQSVFYNPIQQFNRDLSVLAIRAYCDDLVYQKEQKASKSSRSKKRKRGAGSETKPGQVERKEEVALDESPNVPEEGSTNGSAVTMDVSETSKQEPPVEQTESHESMSIASQSNESARKLEDQSTSASIDRTDGKLPPRKGRIKVLDALSATGLRALRYAHEIPQITTVTANDLSKQATEAIEINVKYNNLENKIDVITGNAMSHMYNLLSSPLEWSKPTKYDVIDLDPYGTAVPFLDSAMQAINDGGLLCVTCTDAALWASCGYSEKTYALYGGTPIKGLHSHEGGLRLILHAISTSAARYGMSVEPLLSLSIDFYARVFVRVFQSPAEVKMLAGKTMLVYNCDSGCGAWTTQLLLRNQKTATKNGQSTYKHSLAQGPTTSTLCEHCGSKTHVSGPMYAGPLHNAAFIQSILTQLPTLDTSVYQTTDRLQGMLTTALEEVLLEDGGHEDEKKQQSMRPVPRMDATWVDRNPFFFIPSMLSKIVHARAPSEAEMRGALKHAGFAVTRSHARPGSIKTNAPWSFIWHMMREWVRQKAPIKDGAIKEGTPGYCIMYGAAARERKVTSTQAAVTVYPANDGDAAMSAVEDLPNPAGTAEVGEAEEGLNPKSIVFDEALGKDSDKRRLKRYQENPRANWGPMNRAKR